MFLQPGTTVVKKSGKPFKSGQKTAVILSVMHHPHVTGEWAYIFADGSHVSTKMVVEVEETTYVTCGDIETTTT